ncbi:MAG: hypothetical protein JXB49_10290 [Bacteroidales bacterium]|nr:hypothetical protein [Bacteroidales bacterium]
MENTNRKDKEKIKWARPMSIEELSHIYNVHRNTMSKWLKDQVLCNRHLSPRRWQIAQHELPSDDRELQRQKS